MPEGPETKYLVNWLNRDLKNKSIKNIYTIRNLLFFNSRLNVNHRINSKSIPKDIRKIEREAAEELGIDYNDISNNKKTIFSK